MAADDVRYRAEPESTELWRPDTVLPFAAAKRILGTGDDVAFREALRALRLGRLDLGITSDPELALSRGEARARLQQVATEDADRVRRSRATNLVGVIAFASSLTEARDQAAFVQDAAAAFQTAIELDPNNREAKANLELALQRGRAIQPTKPVAGRTRRRAAPARRARAPATPAQATRWCRDFDLIFLSPMGALIALGVVLPLAALVLVARRGSRLRAALASRARRAGASPSTLAAAVVAALFGVAAAQPVAERRRRSRCGRTRRRTSSSTSPARCSRDRGSAGQCAWRARRRRRSSCDAGCRTSPSASPR